MTGTFNRATIVGNVGRDPEVGQTNSGQRVANFPVATSEQWTDKQSGERVERTQWHRIVIFDQNLVDIVEKYVGKGDKILVEGMLQTRKWQGQDGQDRYTTEIVLKPFRSTVTLLGSRQTGGRDYDQHQQGRPVERQQPAQESAGQSDDLDDEIPF